MGYLSDARDMIGDLRRSGGLRLRVWGPALNLPQVLGGIVFFDQLLAVAIAVSCVGSIVIAGRIHRAEPVSRLTSISHVLWLPILPFLPNALLTVSVTTPYGMWLVYVAVTMAISLGLDIRNLAKFWTGDDRTMRAGRKAPP